MASAANVQPDGGAAGEAQEPRFTYTPHEKGKSAGKEEFANNMSATGGKGKGKQCWQNANGYASGRAHA